MMSNSGPVNELLSAHRAEGVYEGEDSFRISVKAALLKMAEFQLPFYEAWILKLVQCAVSAGAPALRIKLGAKQAEFFFALPEHWSARDIMEAVSGLQSSNSERALEHLAVALRALAFHLKRPFSLALGTESSVHWDGDELVAGPPVATSPPTLRVSYPSGKGLLGVNPGLAINVDLPRVLLTHACYSPIPLEVDGQRLDSLLNYSRKGDIVGIPLIQGTFEIEGLSSWKLPERTVDRTGENWHLKQHSKAMESTGSIPTTCSLCCTLRGHTRHGATFASGESEVLWIRDGVITQVEQLPLPGGSVSMACVIGAEGLETDVSGLALREGPERDSRIELAKKTITPWLKQLELAELDSPSGLAKAVGMTFGVVIPVFGWAALLLSVLDEKTKRAMHLRFQDGLRDLKTAWFLSVPS